MKKEIISDNSKKSYLIKVTNSKDEVGVIPVIDTRDGEDEIKLAKQLVKTSNSIKGSKYLKPSYSEIGISYNLSTKKQKETNENTNDKQENIK